MAFSEDQELRLGIYDILDKQLPYVTFGLKDRLADQMIELIERVRVPKLH